MLVNKPSDNPSICPRSANTHLPQTFPPLMSLSALILSGHTQAASEATQGKKKPKLIYCINMENKTRSPFCTQNALGSSCSQISVLLLSGILNTRRVSVLRTRCAHSQTHRIKATPLHHGSWHLMPLLVSYPIISLIAAQASSQCLCPY